jgi:hypothetical protein
VEACVSCLRAETRLDFMLLECEQQTITGRPSAETLTIVRLKYQGRRHAGLAMHADRVTSAIQALLNAINQFAAQGTHRPVRVPEVAVAQEQTGY